MSLSEILSKRPETQAEMAAKVGVFQTTIGCWERGITLPPSTRLPALASALGMPLDELKAIVAQDRQARRAQVHPAPAPKPDLSEGLARLGDLPAVDQAAPSPTAQGA